jgi:DNA-binding MurR/RpiR family transcriptional regulator
MHQKEKVLATYMMEHPLEVTRSGIKELSAQSGASTATITRFCKTMHCSGFPEFKLKLARELAIPHEPATYQDIIAGNSLDKIIAMIEANHVRSITDTTRLLDLQRLEQAIDAMSRARQIDLYGIATSSLVAQDFYQKLIRIGKRTFTSADPHMQMTSATNLEPGDVAIGFSYSGETLETIDAIHVAKERGAITITLTKYGPNSLASLADIALFASSLEDGMRRGDMASRIAMLHVVDILFVGLVSKSFDTEVPKLEQTYQNVKKFRKDKGR